MNHPNKILLALVGLALTLTIAVASGITALVLIGKVTSVTNELVQLRVENNTATCISSNVTRKAIREDIKNSLFALVPPGTVLSDEQKAQLAVYNKSVDDGLPFRDCSPQGIEKFLQNQPPDPALESLPSQSTLELVP